ncbi:exopolysaccharide biosynthesis polyprenyl glycosylphosphotransferase [Streptomyces sp. NPDC050738]|uniref:exopolysaccharide biosynthesis polyprenyl glycosylphosphotransferase n=1 Tax=Streptomyces sp. NPDC050738 TaxID=3154744 RepID=UPI0034453733
MTTDNTSTSAVPQRVMAATVAGQRTPAGLTARRGRAPAPSDSPVPPLVAADCAAVLVAAVLLEAAQRDVNLLLQLSVLTIALNARGHLYRVRIRPAVLEELPALAARVAVVWTVAAALIAVRRGGPNPQLSVLLGAIGIHLAVVCAVRAFLYGQRRRSARARPRSTLIVGGSSGTHRLCTALAQHPEYGMRAVGVMTTRQAVPQQAEEVPAVPVLSSPEEVVRAVIQNSVRDVLVVGAEGAADHVDLVELLQQYGCAVWLLGSQPAGAHSALAMGEHLWGYDCRLLEPVAGNRRIPGAKRALDLVVAGLMLLLALPVLLVCAAAVRMSDGPGVLFRQERVGMHGREFVLLKFRTLRPADDREAETKWSVAHDARVGAVGRFLRRSSLDELPQLWNVLRGDMSLVGPRPERPFFVAQFSLTYPRYAARHRMVVGLTGLAQVHGLRGDTSIEDRCRFDNHYIDHWSWWQDVCILLRTAKSLTRPGGS